MTSETVVGWDGSEQAETALDWALDRAEARDERVIVVRVVDETVVSADYFVTESTIEAAESALDAKRRELELQHPRLTIETRLLFGDPARELQAQSDPDTLVVVGTQARSGSTARFAWSVGARLAATSHGPVAIIPDNREWIEGARSGIVVGIDGSAASAAAAEYAADEAIHRGASLTAVHAWQTPPMWLDAHLDDESVHALEEVHWGILNTTTAGVHAEFPTLSIEGVVVDEEPQRALHDAALRGRLLVVGNHGMKGVPRLVLGAISHSLILNLESPMVVVRERTQPASPLMADTRGEANHGPAEIRR